MKDEIRKTDDETVKTSPSSEKIQNTHPRQCAKEIEQKLTPLIPMLTDTLCYSEVYQVAEYLKNDQQISKGHFKKFKKSDDITKLVDYLKYNAKEKWTESFLNSIAKIEPSSIHKIVMAFFQSPTHLLTWFVNNWNSLKDKCQLVNHIFVDRKLSDDIHFSQPDWLLCCVHKSLSLKEDERKQLLQALLAVVKNQDQPTFKQQAIKREYVSDKSPPISKQPRMEVDDPGSEKHKKKSKVERWTMTQQKPRQIVFKSYILRRIIWK
ncbi:uncharacterized protein LOC143463383 [Clavelina lepadiformis]|uniref:uncharacterized protein LOC143463383 n=1 Tax=Clavelina lepadiformis TaxID=159417 RepID=UPI004042EAF9